MDRERFVIGDTVWEKIAPLLPGKKSDRGVTAKDNRVFLEAVAYSVDPDQPFRPIAITDSGDPDHAVHYA